MDDFTSIVNNTGLMPGQSHDHTQFPPKRRNWGCLWSCAPQTPPKHLDLRNKILEIRLLASALGLMQFKVVVHLCEFYNRNLGNGCWMDNHLFWFPSLRWCYQDLGDYLSV